jgi:broad specificity phosphatase PhoE
MTPQSNTERFRGSSEIPLTDAGVDGARTLAMQLASKGGLDEIHTSDLGRTVHTSRIISHYTHAPIVYAGQGLHPWHLGQLEGQPITPDSLALQRSLILDTPDASIPGRGPLSTADGESFNSFKDRTIPKLQELIGKVSTDPTRRIGVVTHYRVKKLLDSWMRAGMDPSGAIDPQEMVSHNDSSRPGSIERLTVDPAAGAQMHSVDLSSPGQLGGGLYILRHEKTPWNASFGS